MQGYEIAQKLIQNVNRSFIGKEDVVEHLVICLLTGGHVLLEDVPGVGKTTLAKVLAQSIDLSFGRIQFTPDTLPSDVSGVSIYNMKTGEFEYKAGAVMHQILLADEINRTSPKTQASLLEVMSEEQVTVDGNIHRLPQPFMVIATQNPIEFLGTYPLPEAQMDRFMMRLTLGYPNREEEIRLASMFLRGETPDRTERVCTAEEILALRGEVSKVTIKDAVLGYIEDIVRNTRNENRFVLGASPRAMLTLMRASQGKAFLEGRDYVKPDDVKAMAIPVLLHRLVLTSEAKIRQENPEAILKSRVLEARVPTL